MNYLRTLALLATLTGLFLYAGQALGGRDGLIVASLVALLMNFGSYWFSDRIVLRMYRAREIEPAESPDLDFLVRDLAVRASLPMPRLYLIPEAAPNAFATGRNPRHGVIAVTEGLLRLLTRDEIRGVIAHELSHIKHRDTLIMSVVAAIAGGLSMLANAAMWRSLFRGGQSSGNDDHGGHPLAGAIAIIIAPLAAMLIQLAVSRGREIAADEEAARLSHEPLALANALKKIESWSARLPIATGSPATAHLFIQNPFSGGVLVHLFSTHPPTRIRIQRLEAIARERHAVAV